MSLDPRPATLRAWRQGDCDDEGPTARNVSMSLEPFFTQINLTLWRKAKFGFHTRPPNDLLRAPDGFVFTTIAKWSDEESLVTSSFQMTKASFCAARTDDNRDVVIRLVAKGSEGREHLSALRRIGGGVAAFRGDNHAVPILREVEIHDMIFVVFPKLEGDRFDLPRFYAFAEVVDCVYQLLEGLQFLHDNLVAHLDIDSDNILINHYGRNTLPPGGSILNPPEPFRSLFPVRYYINDFELAVCFDQDSRPEDRLIKGLPTEGRIEGKYGRDPAPEMLLPEAYCPFSADVWQMGHMFMRYFGNFSHLSSELVKLFAEMSGDNPSSRPTAATAFQTLVEIRRHLSADILESSVPEPVFPDEDGETSS